MRGDGAPVIADIQLGLEADNALLGDLCAFETADQFFRLAGKHRTGNHFKPARMRRYHCIAFRVYF